MKKATLLIIFYELAFIPLALLSLQRKEPFYMYFETLNKYSLRALLLALTTLLVTYGILCVKHKLVEQLPIKKLMLLLTPLIILLIVTPPLLSRDTLAYIIPAKNFVVYNKDPYTTPLNSVIQNDWTQYIEKIWAHKSVYGPIFNLIMIPFGAFDNLNLGIAIYKLLVTGAYFGSIFIIYKLYGNTKALLLLLNPVLIVHFIMEGHNDVFVLFLLMLALYFHANNKKWISYLFLGLSINIKYYTMFLIPAFSVKNSRVNIKEFIKLLSVCGVTTLITGIIYRGYFPNLLSNDVGFYTAHCIYACTPLDLIMKYIPIDMPIILIKIALLGGFYLYMYYKSIDNRLYWIYLIFMILSFVYLSWLTSWFLIFPIVFALLSDSKRLYYVSYMLTMYSFLHYFGI